MMRKRNIFKSLLVVLLAGLMSVGLAGNLNAQQGSLTELLQKARNAGVEEAVLQELQTRAESRGISDQQLMDILQPAVALAEQKLPADHAIQKALEGLSKGVPADRVATVLNRIGQSTSEAVRIVDPWMQNENVQSLIENDRASREQFRNDLVVAASRGLSQDVAPGTVQNILNQINDKSTLSNTTSSNIVAAIGVLPDLSTTADQPQLSEAFLVRAIKGGFGAAEFQKLPTALSVAQQRSQLPASSIIQGVANQLQGGIPAAQIFQNLFNGNVGAGPPGNIPKGLENIPDRGQGSSGS